MKRILLILFIVFISPITASASVVSTPIGELHSEIIVRPSSNGSRYYDSKTGKEVSREYVEAGQRAYKQKQKDFALTAKMVCLPIAMGLLGMFFFIDKNDTVSKAVFETMLRYISILISIGLLVLMCYVLVADKGYKQWQWYVCTLVIIINLLALLRLDTGKSYFSTFIRRKQIENEMKTLEAEKKLDELKK